MDTNDKPLTTLERLEQSRLADEQYWLRVFEDGRQERAVLFERARQIIEKLPTDIIAPLILTNYDHNYNLILTLFWKTISPNNDPDYYFVGIQPDLFTIGSLAFDYKDIEAELCSRLIKHFQSPLVFDHSEIDVPDLGRVF